MKTTLLFFVLALALVSSTLLFASDERDRGAETDKVPFGTGIITVFQDKPTTSTTPATASTQPGGAKPDTGADKTVPQHGRGNW